MENLVALCSRGHERHYMCISHPQVKPAGRRSTWSPLETCNLVYLAQTRVSFQCWNDACTCVHSESPMSRCYRRSLVLRDAHTTIGLTPRGQFMHDGPIPTTYPEQGYISTTTGRHWMALVQSDQGFVAFAAVAFMHFNSPMYHCLV